MSREDGLTKPHADSTLATEVRESGHLRERWGISVHSDAKVVAGDSKPGMSLRVGRCDASVASSL